MQIYHKIENSDKFKEINIKNCTCYYFDEITKFKDFDLDKILIDEKSHENVLVYNIQNIDWCKTVAY